MLTVRLCAAAMCIAVLGGACSDGSHATAEVRICKAYSALSKEGPKRYGSAATDPGLQAIKHAGKPTDPRVAMIQQDASLEQQGGPRGLTPADVTYLYEHCEPMGVVLDQSVVVLPWKAGVTAAQLDAYLAQPDPQRALLGLVLNEEPDRRAALLFVPSAWNATRRAQAVAAVERSGLVGPPQPAVRPVTVS